MNAGSSPSAPHRWRLPVVLLLLLLLPLCGWSRSIEEIAFGPPEVIPETPENRRRVEALAAAAATRMNRKYGDYIRIQAQGAAGPPACELDILAVYQEDGSVLSLTLRRRDGREAELSLIDGGSPDNGFRLAAAVFLLWGSLQDTPVEPLQPHPVYVDELPAETIAETLLPGMPGMSAALTPMSAAVRPDGNLLVGFSFLCAELSPDFRVLGQPGRVLYDEGNTTFAADVAVTPGNTLFLKPSLGREIYRLPEGLSRPRRLRIGIDLFGPFAALPDGSVVVIDLQNRRALRVDEGRRLQLPLFSGPNSYISALTVGPEGNIWVYDVVERSIRIHSPRGELIDTIMPLMDPAEAAAAVALSVYSDGRFVLSLAGAAPRLSCFTRLGVPVWHLDKLPAPAGIQHSAGGEPLPRNALPVLDSGSGRIYLTDRTGRRIIKLLDAAYAADHGIDNPGEAAVLAWNRRLDKNPQDAQARAGLAKHYENAGSFEMARLHWQTALDLNPSLEVAARRLESIDIALLKQNARSLHDRTVEVLTDLGPESARITYSRALQLYERILSLDSSDREAAAEMAELKATFRDREIGAAAPPGALKITEIRVQDLFPSLLHIYRRSPPAAVTVRNTTSRELRDMKASIFIKRLMDFPQSAPTLPRLTGGDSATFDLPVVFNPAVLELQEDLPVQALIKISCLAETGPQTVEETRSLTVRRRTALVWDDSARLSSFITPNEGIVNRFSHRVAAGEAGTGGFRLSGKLLRAMRICDALGKYGIEYIEDPDSPISRVLGRENRVDTVRFPRTTLLIRSGDCDDSTALLASLLESSGIATAIMTSPGHVFLAFNSEEPAANDWLLNAEGLVTLPHRGELWIPVESTVLAQGFMTAWREASRLVATYAANGQIEFLPLADQRGVYPPLPLPESSFTVVEPPAAEVDALYRGTLQEMEMSLHTGAAAALSEQAGRAAGRQKARLLNRLGILHSLFGRDHEAEQTFTRCRKEFPDYLSPAVNLAHLHISRREFPTAERVLLQALAGNPDSVPVNLLLAEAYYRQGRYRLIAEHFNKVEARAPELARRYAYLAQSGLAENGGRGAAAAAGPPLPWDAE